MKRRITALLLAVGFGVGFAVAVAAPAQASFSDCNVGTACIWNATNGSGTPIGGGFSATPGTCFDLFGAQNDSADSFRNRTTKSIQFYDNHGCTGQLLKSEDGRTIFDGVTQANFMQVDQVMSHPGCQYPSTCNRNRASSVFFNTAFAGPLLTQTERDGPEECGAGTVCAWDNSNFTGLLFSVQHSSGFCWNLPASLQDRANGFYNHRGNGKGVQFFRSTGCTAPLRDWNGSHGPFPDGEISLFYHTINANDQDHLRSVFWNTG